MRAAAPIALAVVALGCSFDRGDRWVRRSDEPAPAACTVGERSCELSALRQCVAAEDGPRWEITEDCAPAGEVCAPALLSCATCVPDDLRCEGQRAERCRDDGSGWETDSVCDVSTGAACRAGLCTQLCSLAKESRSNVGCEYWAVDLDNANVDESLNAAAQQFAVVVSNPQPDVPAEVTIERDDAPPGSESRPNAVARATVLPLSLQVFRLGPREVDGSTPGTFDTGTHSALSRGAYRITTSVPVVAYQFNPLENVNVFSNDASLLKPVEALIDRPGELGPAYAVIGWPQTIASTSDPETNFGQSSPIDLRSFLTIVGTRSRTRVRVITRARVVPGTGIPETAQGGTLELSLEPFEVANLETGGFNADFTGSIVEADQPVVVFSGGEASDAPYFDRLAERRCCADHLEEQLDPLRTAGRRFVAALSPNRSVAVAAAGGNLSPVDAPEYFRLIAATDGGAVVRTTLPGDAARIELSGLGDFAHVEARSDFLVESDAPIMLGSISASQDAAGVPSGLPGGDPSFLIIPPVEQYRADYVFLTPDKYSFDFVRLLVPDGTTALLDGQGLDELDCDVTRLGSVSDAGAGYAVHRCQLSFPVLDTSLEAAALIQPGRQNDGVHEVVASGPIGVLVDGFDRNVSYAYAAGTELTEIVLR